MEATPLRAMPPHQTFCYEMKMKPHIARSVALWGGATLLVVGLVTAAVTIWSAVYAGHTPTDAEAMAEELRANGAIVENYYQVLGSGYHPTPRPVRIAPYVVAGMLVTAGGILILKAPSISRNQP